MREIPDGDLRLGAEAVAPGARVGGIRGPVEVEVLKPAVGPVVDGQAEYRHIVGVEHAVDEPDPHPLDDERHGAFGHLSEEGHDLGGIQMREVGGDRELDESSGEFEIAAGTRELEVSESRERRCHTADHGAGFGLGVAVIEHVPDHFLAGGHQ